MGYNYTTNLQSKPHTHMATLPGSNVLTNVLTEVKNLCSLTDYLNDNYISIKFSITPDEALVETRQKLVIKRKTFWFYLEKMKTFGLFR